MNIRRLTAIATAVAGVATAQVMPVPPLPEGTTDDIPTVGDLTVVTSERLVYDAEKRIAVFERDVVVSDPNLRMKTEKLTIHFDEKNQPTQLQAEGRVILSQAEIRAWADKVTFDVATGRVTLEGNPRVLRGRDMLMAQRIVFYRNQSRIECYPEARLILYPQPGGGGDLWPGGR